ncbi:hypothetical protein AQUCO_03700328v1 [Aquilegia coerulea]|uniref:Plastid lipid-associated protein/fibrillin conserved domain-containing protein n=1 Tax=Aquilegia coerulea TaxID=218851 RepID=A0A2G5CUN3_AQUCA|nr:hypothetical protein AQUCO_03700328v1 [Aquilegia coerulea]
MGSFTLSSTLLHHHHHPSSLPIAGGFLQLSQHQRKPFSSCVAVSSSSSSSPISTNNSDSTSQSQSRQVETNKHELLRAIQETQRGFLTTPDQRFSIEQALVCVEKYDAASAIQLNNLDGTWRLQYTSAPDVLVLFDSAQRFPSLLQVGQIFQKFECLDQNNNGGIVRNVVRWSIPSLLEEEDGATLLVSAKFSVISKRNIYLQFEEISVQDIKISEGLQALIAPALLPRTFLSLQILQFLQTLKAQLPVASPGSQSVGGLYYLSYLDGDMLIGRAVGGGGVFVFTRAQPL